mmetsp:Transcript_17771/g.40718  ORF Transcript_17771/g.40718 Transcript_17771/m.40718 type:complete len:285 (-) Transcript_17771:533-1387(-)
MRRTGGQLVCRRLFGAAAGPRLTLQVWRWLRLCLSEWRARARATCLHIWRGHALVRIDVCTGCDFRRRQHSRIDSHASLRRRKGAAERAASRRRCTASLRRPLHLRRPCSRRSGVALHFRGEHSCADHHAYIGLCKRRRCNGCLAAHDDVWRCSEHFRRLLVWRDRCRGTAGLAIALCHVDKYHLGGGHFWRPGGRLWRSGGAGGAVTLRATRHVDLCTVWRCPRHEPLRWRRARAARALLLFWRRRARLLALRRRVVCGCRRRRVSFWRGGRLCRRGGRRRRS